MPTLAHLSIRNLALVDEVDFELGPGLNVLTGETGAGKSVLIGSLSLLLGARASPELIRDGCKEATVQATFVLNPQGDRLSDRLRALGASGDKPTAVIRRTLRSKGRGRVEVNGHAVTVAALAELLSGVLDLTGQHEHMSLLCPERHLALLDDYAGLQQLRGEVEEAHGRASALGRELAGLRRDADDKARREDYLRFALEEIEGLSPTVGELEALREERQRLRHAGTLSSTLTEAELALYSGEGAVVEMLGRWARRLNELVPIDVRMSPYADAASGLVAEVEELARSLAREARGLPTDPTRLDGVEDRIERLDRLVRKYGGSIEAVLVARKGMAAELDGLESVEGRAEELRAEHGAARARLEASASALSEARRIAATRFEAEVEGALRELAMGQTTLSLQLAPLPEIGPRGGESLEILLAPNRGEPPRPLRKTASGGELSRLLLAVKQVVAGRSEVGTYVFDEIDTGIGGGVAEVLGLKLRQAAKSAQVIAVTHLAPVAAFAERHFRVVKHELGHRTATKVEELSGADSVREIARMLGGKRITPKTLALAEELRSRGEELEAVHRIGPSLLSSRRSPRGPRPGRGAQSPTPKASKKSLPMGRSSVGAPSPDRAPATSTRSAQGVANGARSAGLCPAGHR